MTDDCVNLDHRQSRAFTPGDVIPFLRATWDVATDVKGHIEDVHRLNNLRVVITEVVTGTSNDGFDFELREVAIFVFDGELTCRFELFDEEDLDAALATFDQLTPPPPRLENTASRTADRVMAHFSAREWEGAAELVADDLSSDDRRRTVNAGSSLVATPR